MAPNQGEEGQISAELRKVLNSHGHGFHYDVVRRDQPRRYQLNVGPSLRRRVEIYESLKIKREGRKTVR